MVNGRDMFRVRCRHRLYCGQRQLSFGAWPSTHDQVYRLCFCLAHRQCARQIVTGCRDFSSQCSACCGSASIEFQLQSAKFLKRVVYVIYDFHMWHRTCALSIQHCSCIVSAAAAAALISYALSQNCRKLNCSCD